MSSQDHRGAKAPSQPGDLSELVANLIHLSIDAVSELSSYDKRTCDLKIRELTTYLDNPTGPSRPIAQVLGKLTLLYEQRAKLQATEHAEELRAMQAVCRAEQEAKSHLQATNSHLLKEMDEAQREQDQTLQECEALRAQIKLQEEKEVMDTGDSQSGLANPELFPESGIDASPSGSNGTETLGDQLRDPQAAEVLLWQTQHTQQRSNPVNMTPRGEPAATPRRTVTRDYQSTPRSAVTGDYQATPRSMVTRDYQTTPGTRLADADDGLQPEISPLVRNQPAPHQDDGRTPPWRADGYSQPARNPAYVGTPSTTQADARYGSRPRPGWSSNPGAGRDDQYRGEPESDDSDSSAAPWRDGICTRQLESLSKDIDRFDPDVQGSNIDDYLREVERCLLDLASPSSREKLKLIWKTTARNVHAFMETLSPGIRDRYSALCQALREEYSLFTDQASATLGAFAVVQRKNEPPREYYRRLRTAYFQGRNAPGLEEETAFRSLFLHNLHESVRYDVTMHCRAGNLTMREMRRYSQLAWETRTRPGKGPEQDARVLGIQAQPNVDLALEGNDIPHVKTNPGRENRERRPDQQSTRGSRGNEGSNQPRNLRPRYLNTSQQRGRDWSEREHHQRQEKGYGDKYPKQERQPERGMRQEHWHQQERGRRQEPTRTLESARTWEETGTVESAGTTSTDASTNGGCNTPMRGRGSKGSGDTYTPPCTTRLPEKPRQGSPINVTRTAVPHLQSLLCRLGKLRPHKNEPRNLHHRHCLLSNFLGRPHP